jgi:hypothetical protein
MCNFICLSSNKQHYKRVVEGRWIDYGICKGLVRFKHNIVETDRNIRTDRFKQCDGFRFRTDTEKYKLADFSVEKWPSEFRKHIPYPVELLWKVVAPTLHLIMSTGGFTQEVRYPAFGTWGLTLFIWLHSCIFCSRDNEGRRCVWRLPEFSVSRFFRKLQSKIRDFCCW